MGNRMEALMRSVLFGGLGVALGFALSGCLNPLGRSQSEIPANHRPGDAASLAASAVQIVSGDTQTAMVATSLSQPLRIRVLNALNVPVVGESVTFSASGAGGSFSQTTVATDADGYAQSTWTLGTVAGVQTSSATIQGGAAGQNFSATAQPGPAVTLEFQSQPTLSNAETNLATSPVVRARDSYGNLASSFTQTVTVALQTNPSVATLSGTVSVAASGGVATFSSLNVDRGGIGYRLSATAAALSVNSDLFDVRCRQILDSVATPVAAYSLRKLRTAYTGAALRVRRSSDNTERDIGFDSVNCGLDEAALTAFAATTPISDLFVRTWYDQSGNSKHAVQTTMGTQPRIATAGVLEKENARTIIRFNGATAIPGVDLGIAGTGGFAYNLVLRPRTVTSGTASDGSGTYFIDRIPETNGLVSLKASAGFYMFQKRTDASSGLAGFSSLTGISTSAFQRVVYERQRGVQFRVYLNGVQEAAATDSESHITPGVPQIGRHSVATTASNFGMTELLIFGSHMVPADRTAIDGNQAKIY